MKNQLWSSLNKLYYYIHYLYEKKMKKLSRRYQSNNETVVSLLQRSFQDKMYRRIEECDIIHDTNLGPNFSEFND